MLLGPTAVFSYHIRRVVPLEPLINCRTFDQPELKQHVFLITALLRLTSDMLLPLRFPLLIVVTTCTFTQTHGRGKHVYEGII